MAADRRRGRVVEVVKVLGRASFEALAALREGRRKDIVVGRQCNGLSKEGGG